MVHRIFIAINLPEDVKQKLSDYQKKLADLFMSCQDSFNKEPVRWVKKHNLHLTLIFLGNTSDQELYEICKITKQTASKEDPFFINFNKICYGPQPQNKFSEEQTINKKIPRFIWVEGEKNKELIRLRQNLEKALFNSKNRSSSQLEKRGFLPHLTLGRIKQWEWKKIEPEERPEIEQEISLSVPVNSVEIMESKLKREGPEYTILESIKL